MERAAGLSQTVAGMTGTPSEAGILSDTLKGQLQEMSAGLQADNNMVDNCLYKHS